MRQLASFGALAVVTYLWWGTLQTRATPVHASAQHTRVRIFEPFSVTGVLLPRFRNARWVSGSCLDGSDVDPRGWWCISGHLLLQPCFASRGSRNGLLCPRSPWSRVALHLRLQKPLPSAHHTHGGRLPWAVTLGNGGRCIFFSPNGARAVAGMRLNYRCSNGDDASGGVSRRSGYWSIVVRQPRSQVLTRTYITVAWY
jgi:hypothetical protein